MAGNKPSRDQKRKQKLAQRRERQRERAPAVQPYEGRKYQTDRLAPWFHATESAIRDCDVTLKRQVTDQQVVEALGQAAEMLRRG